MRVVIFVAVVAAHLILFLLFPAWRPVSVAGREDGGAVTPIYLPPWAPEPTPEPASQPTWQAPLLYRSGAKHGKAEPAQRGARTAAAPTATPTVAPAETLAVAPTREPTGAPTAGSTQPDWHAQAQALAEQDAKEIVAAEDVAQSRAKALTARIKPMVPARVPGPGFAWDYAPTHRITALPQGGFVYAINDNCQIMILPMPFLGCVIGKLPANGDLFENMHPPMKYGDWDWRVGDP